MALSVFLPKTRVELRGRRIMYQVLYRKWRPQTFSDVYGQPQVTVTLRNELKSGRIAHAYLFTGSRGTGKTSCAKILAKAVNCLDPHDGDPCNKCSNCIGIDNESILDVVEMDAASNNGIDDIRDLREELRYTPSTAKYRVLIIDEVHMLSNSAFNALLKTLEEPPEHVVFVLATTEVHKLPATILSRCQRFDFRRIAPQDISARLKYVAEQENKVLTDSAAALIARLSDGGMRDALSLLDQCMGNDGEINDTVVRKIAGIAGRDHLYKIGDAIAKGDCGEIMSILDSLHNGSKDMARLTQEIIEYFRNIMVFKSVKDPRELILVSDEEFAELETAAEKIKLEAVLHAIDLLIAANERMAGTANSRIELEMTLLKIANPAMDDSNSALLRRISALENTVKSGIPINPQALQNVKNKVEENRTQRIRTTNVPSCADAERIECWADVLERVKALSAPLYGALQDSNGYKKDNFVFVEAQVTGLTLLRQSQLKEYLRSAIKDVLGFSCNLGPYRVEAQTEKEKDPIDVIAEMANEAGIPIE